MHKHLWETFNPHNGQTRWIVPFKWMAKWLSKHDEIYWEYGKWGEGWLNA